MPRHDPLLAEHVILAHILADQGRGGVADAAHYHALFPDDRDVVDRVLRELQQDAGAAGSERYGPFEVQSVLGRGGQGVVYLARDTGLPRTVALKVLHDGRTVDEQHRQRFRREAEIAARLDHPTLCRVLAYGIEGDTPYLAMPFVDGSPLSAAIAAGDGRPLELSQFDSATSSSRRQARGIDNTLLLIEKLARGLHVAHELGVVHRDVKPANIMLTPSGEPVLLDFGLARDEHSGTHTLTMSQDVLGTPAYMSPEQVAGQPVDRRADCFALAVVLYECLCGERPFQGATRQALFAAIQRGEFVPPSRRVPSLPRDLDLVLSVALDIDPNRRYLTTAALADDLARVRAREPAQARPIGPARRCWRWCQRNRAVAISAAIVLLVSVTAATVATAAWLRSEDARTETEAINQYILKDLLLAASPGAFGREARVVDALDRAAARVDLRFGDRPALAATVRTYLADALRSLGQWSEASTLAAQALATRERQLGAAAAPSLEARLQVAWLAELQSEHQQVLDMLQDHAAQFAATFGVDSPQELRCRALLATARLHLGDRDLGLQQLRAIDAAARRAHGPGSDVVQHTSGALLGALRVHKRHEEGLQFARQRLGELEQEYGADSADAAEAGLDLGSLLLESGDPEPAVPALQDAIARFQRSYGERHPILGTAEALLASAFTELRRFDDAIAHNRTAHAIYEQALGADNPWTLSVQSDLAIAYRAAHQNQQAREVATAVLASSRRAFGERSLQVATALDVLASICINEADWQAVAEYGQQAVAITEELHGPDAAELPGFLWNLARGWHELRDYPRALAAWERLIALDRKGGGDDSPWVASDLRRYGESLYHAGRYRDAVRAYDDALRIRGLADAPDEATIAGLRAWRALARYRGGERAGGREQLETSWAELERLGQLSWWNGSDLFSVMEEIYRSAGDQAALAALAARRTQWPGIH